MADEEGERERVQQRQHLASPVLRALRASQRKRRRGVEVFTSDAAGSAPRGETPIQPNSAVRVLDNEAALVEHGLSAKFLGKRLLAFHEAPARASATCLERQGKRTSSSVVHSSVLCRLSLHSQCLVSSFVCVLLFSFFRLN